MKIVCPTQIGTYLILLLVVHPSAYISAFVPTIRTESRIYDLAHKCRVVDSSRTAPTNHHTPPMCYRRQSMASQHLCMLPVDNCSMMWIATIDSDIAKIPDNEFGLVFAGGIAVMFGGLFSTLFVGWIVDSKNLYANIVADSYAQGADDEEFWKGLSNDEKIRTKELLEKVKNSRNGKTQEGMESLKAMALSEDRQQRTTDSTASAPSTKEQSEVLNKEKDAGLFSDY